MTPMQLKAMQAAKLAQLQASAPVAAPLSPEELALHPVRTFMHQVAGASFIMPDGRKLVFAGKTTLASEGRRAGFGYYVTNVPEEVEQLAYLVKVPTSQVTELVTDAVTHTERAVYKQVDPAIQQSADDAAKNAERFFDPRVSAVVENLGAHVASGMAADSQGQQA